MMQNTVLTCLADYEATARLRLPADIWAYLNAGAADGLSQQANGQAAERLTLWPRVLRSTAGSDASVMLWGERHASPILIGPTAYHRLAHPEGELASVMAAAALQAGMVVSTLSSLPLESIATRAQCPLWFQLYLQRRRDITLDLVRRAEAAGYRALMVTVDAPIQGARNAEQRAGFRLPAGVEAANLVDYPVAPGGDYLAAGQSVFALPGVQAAPTWEDLAWLSGQTCLPVIVKGILHPLDVQPALEAGAAGIVVSNHGGRVLDTVPATLDALPLVVEAVAGRVPVLVDGGIRRGTDILKALALGAQAVLIGRPVLHGLAVGGASGVAHVLHLLRAELEMAMVLAGLRTLEEVRSGSVLAPGRPA